MSKKEWFDEWFNTIYYHILYKNRDHTEASLFLDHIIEHLDINLDAKIMDLACGKGRHSIYLNKKGFDVTGLDLSVENIKYANTHANESLRFGVRNLR